MSNVPQGADRQDNSKALPSIAVTPYLAVDIIEHFKALGEEANLLTVATYIESHYVVNGGKVPRTVREAIKVARNLGYVLKSSDGKYTLTSKFLKVGRLAAASSLSHAWKKFIAGKTKDDANEGDGKKEAREEHVKEESVEVYVINSESNPKSKKHLGTAEKNSVQVNGSTTTIYLFAKFRQGWQQQVRRSPSTPAFHKGKPTLSMSLRAASLPSMRKSKFLLSRPRFRNPKLKQSGMKLPANRYVTPSKGDAKLHPIMRSSSVPDLTDILDQRIVDDIIEKMFNEIANEMYLNEFVSKINEEGFDKNNTLNEITNKVFKDMSTEKYFKEFLEKAVKNLIEQKPSLQIIDTILNDMLNKGLVKDLYYRTIAEVLDRSVLQGVGGKIR